MHLRFRPAIPLLSLSIPGSLFVSFQCNLRRRSSLPTPCPSHSSSPCPLLAIKERWSLWNILNPPFRIIGVIYRVDECRLYCSSFCIPILNFLTCFPRCTFLAWRIWEWLWDVSKNGGLILSNVFWQLTLFILTGAKWSHAVVCSFRFSYRGSTLHSSRSMLWTTSRKKTFTGSVCFDSTNNQTWHYWASLECSSECYWEFVLNCSHSEWCNCIRNV